MFDHSFGASSHAKFGVNALQVMAHRIVGDTEPVSDFLVHEATCQAADDFLFAGTEEVMMVAGISSPQRLHESAGYLSGHRRSSADKIQHGLDDLPMRALL